MVRAGGVEPPRAYTHCHLKTARLPFRHARRQSINLHCFILSNKSACRDWRMGTKRLAQAACSALYCVPQSFIASMIGWSVRPVSVSEYSTRGGTSGYTSRCTNPSRSIWRRFAVSTFCDTLPTERRSSPNRMVPFSRSRRISTFHLSEIINSVVSTGHAGNSRSIRKITPSRIAIKSTKVPFW